eukprot:TRINITY_DN5642_c0_g1_i1.p1 TRINITY_DN5642_c0_g1~~TRINITY_DN5642_c0_g1_i1.p1  ORF type:complete len:237 (-),score=27.81 TRINITY_DN5642_c0_g1_i1:223-933(-)
MLELPTDHLMTLGLQSNATMEEVKAAYRKLILMHHPDKNEGSDTNHFQAIHNAYQSLIATIEAQSDIISVDVPTNFETFTSFFDAMKTSTSEDTNKIRLVERVHIVRRPSQDRIQLEAFSKLSAMAGLRSSLNCSPPLPQQDFLEPSSSDVQRKAVPTYDPIYQPILPTPRVRSASPSPTPAIQEDYLVVDVPISIHAEDLPILSEESLDLICNDGAASEVGESLFHLGSMARCTS